MLINIPGCGGAPPPPPPKDIEYTQAMSTGRSAFERGQPEQAALFYTQALRRAEARDDAEDIGNAAYNLGASLMASGRFREAREVLAESRMEFVSRVEVLVPDVVLLEARAAWRTGDVAFAEQLADSIAMAGEKHQHMLIQPSGPITLEDQAAATLLLGEIAVSRGDRELARKRRAQANDYLPALARPDAPSKDRRTLSNGLAASALGIDADLAEGDGNPKRAAELYDLQANRYQAGGNLSDMASALSRAGRSWMLAGMPRDAADRYFRAARSARARGDFENAAEWARQSGDAARKAGATDVARRADALLTGPATQPAP